MIHERAPGWTEILSEILGRPGRVRPYFQPVVDLQRGEVCGYEALARFEGWRALRPADVFAAAERRGLGGALEAHMVREVLETLPHLPSNRFLAVNASPRALLAEEVHDAFAEADRLDRVIVEVTEQTDANVDPLLAELDALRARGALIAVDDAGAGYGSLSRITALRPHFVKIDRGLVANLDAEPAKAAVVQTLGELAARIDAWIIEEGVERMEELDALMELHVPLAQGVRVRQPDAGDGGARAGARPAHPLALPARRGRDGNRGADRGGSHAARAGLPARARLPLRPPPEPDYVALVDRNGRPSGLVRRSDHARGEGPERNLMLVTPDMPLAVVTRRAMTRPAQRRFDPLVCWDESGRYAGLVRIERAVDLLARAA